MKPDCVEIEVLHEVTLTVEKSTEAVVRLYQGLMDFYSACNALKEKGDRIGEDDIGSQLTWGRLHGQLKILIGSCHELQGIVLE